MRPMHRRSFLKRSSGFGAMAALGGLGTVTAYTPAYAADLSGYKALVCVFLKGGLDSADMILPRDTESHNALKSLRQDVFTTYNVGSGSSSRDIENLSNLFPLNRGDFGTRKFGVPEDMVELRYLFNSEEAAIVGNVGPLIQPTTRDSIDRATSEIPKRLFSHNDQQSTWMSMGVEGAVTGWGGRFVDAINATATSGPGTFTSISTAGSDVFLAGEQSTAFSAPIGGTQSLDVLSLKNRLGNNSAGDAARAIMRKHLSSEGSTDPNLILQDIINANGSAIKNSDDFTWFTFGLRRRCPSRRPSRPQVWAHNCKPSRTRFLQEAL